MNKQRNFLSFYRELQKQEFPEIKDLRKVLNGVGKKLSLKNIYFLSYAVRSLVQNLKAQKLRDLEENLIVQIEVQLQLLSAQLESTVFGEEVTREKSGEILGVLLSNQVKEIGSIFQELRTLAMQKKNDELTSTIEKLDSIFSAMNKNLPLVVGQSSMLDSVLNCE